MRSMMIGAALALAALSLAIVQGAAASAKLPLRSRLIQSGEFRGFQIEPGLAQYSTASLWVQADPNLGEAQAAAERARLRREGFKGLDQELLDRNGVKGAGVSWTMQLRSHAAARAELAASIEGYRKEDGAMGATFSRFAVPGVPGARGFELSGAGQVGDNIFFADGPFLYLVGTGWAMSDANPPTRAGLIAAVKKLYGRVHGRSA